LFIGPLLTFRANFMPIRSERFCAKLLTDKQTDGQTNNDENITFLGGGNEKQAKLNYSIGA